MSTVDFFLKVDGIEGESADSKHKNEIDVFSFSWGAQQTGTMAFGGGGGAGKVQMNDFHFVMKVNKSTPKLVLACASGEHIPKATFIARKAGKDQQEYLKIVFSDILVSSYQTGASSGGDSIPMDQISLNYSKVEYEYKPQKSDGTLDGPIKAGWDLKQNVKV